MPEARTATVRDRLVLAAPVLVVALIVLSAASGPSTLVPASRNAFPRWLAGPLPEVGRPLPGAPLGIALLLLLVLYLAAVLVAPRAGLRAVVVSVVAAHVLLFLGPPLLSADVFGYIGSGRLAVLHGVSPYAHGAAALGDDPARRFILWRDAISPYGPVFNLFASAVAFAGVAGALWTYKALAVAASLCCLAIVVRTARVLGREPARAAALIGLNPVLLVFAVGGAHNDLVIAALTAFAISLAARGSAARATPAVLAAATKASALVLVPFTLVTRPRARAVLAAIVLATLLGAVALAIFGAQLSGMTRALAQQQHQVATHSVPAELASALGFRGLPAGVRVLSVVGFAAAVLLALRHARRTGDPTSAAGWATLALLVTSAWLLPWYGVWLLPLAALAGARRLELATFALTAYLVAGRVTFLLG